MKYLLRISLFAAVLLLGNYATAQDADTLKKLDEALQAVPTFQQGDTDKTHWLTDIEKIVFTLPPDAALRETIEQKLLDTLQATTTADGKSFLCRQLRVIGTAKAIPYLEKLLTDPDASHMAVYALGRLEAPGTSAALLRGLAKTSGDMQAGIINALADRGYQAAKPDFVKRVDSPDANVARAAVRGLGRLGGADAVAVLKAARPKASQELALDIDNALLGCAAKMLAAGQQDDAAAIYEMFYQPEQPKQLRAAGLRGLTMARGEEAADLLVEAIQKGDADLQRTAILLVGLVPGEKATKAFAGLLTSLPNENKTLLLSALGMRGDSSAAACLIGAVQDQDQTVRLAALEALGSAGDVSAVSPLIEAAVAAPDDTEREVARSSLRLLGGDAINPKLLRLVGDADAAVRIEAIHALAGRKAGEAVGGLLKAVADKERAVRAEALRAIGRLAGESDLPGLLKLAVKPSSTDDQAAVEEALRRTLLRVESVDSRAKAVLDALKTAPTAAKPMLIRLLAESGSTAALDAVRAALKSSDTAIVDAAMQALLQWPNVNASETLFDLVGNASTDEQKELAVQAYVHLAAISDDPTAMYLGILGRVTRVNSKKLILSSLGLSSTSPTTLELVMKYLDDENLQATAGLAALRIANRLKDQDQQLARTALAKVIDVVRNEDVHQRAQEVVNDMDKEKDHILQWVGVGPFVEEGKRAEGIYATAFPPENPDAQDIQWKPLTEGVGSWSIDLQATYSDLDHCAAYARTRVWSAVDQDAQLEMGCDDAVKAWLNGRLVFDEYGGGSCTPRQHRVKIKLTKGWNVLMLKLVDQEGGWSFCCRIRKPDGTALEGLKIEAK